MISTKEEFRNELSISDFIKWNSTESIDVLISNGYPIMGAIPSALRISR